jgi:hypothetical protein
MVWSPGWSCVEACGYETAHVVGSAEQARAEVAMMGACDELEAPTRAWVLETGAYVPDG